MSVLTKLILLVTMLMTACGQGSGGGGSDDDSSAEPEKSQPSALVESLPMAFADAASLPPCDGTAVNRIAYVTAETQFKICDGTAWGLLVAASNICHEMASRDTEATKLREGLPKATVLKILGTPALVSDQAVSFPSWEYDEPICAKGEPYCAVQFGAGDVVTSFTRISPDYIDLTAP